MRRVRGGVGVHSTSVAAGVPAGSSNACLPFPMSTESAVSLPDSAQRVALLLQQMGHDQPVVMLPQTGKTSAEAAAGLGCQVAQIAKSIIFRRATDNAPVLVVASGINRVDEAKVAERVGPLARADARFVREATGYAIGGVSPIGHVIKPVMLLDEDLFQYDSIWAAAGHPNAVFRMTPAQLAAMTGAPVADVAQRA
ncbi:Cys-tRNA(Pro)/Cys-tRNA(Cys) deacylase ybaK [Bordetella ansorpii]|uniref:Cys-tRNA(Pro)/Cys-tRNA(Cys) deacylase ybaK n=2 Tax=Bordetella ansorpii TaxID=288768 RepID=A0A157SS34_9BORD|nr:Cys-tRNA(Pro)/Cys-tRNA(Cys) deacylase ybaK [Bordetella ansorpii]